MTPAHFDLLLVDAHLATMRAGGTPYGDIRDGAVGVRGDTIAWVGRRARLAARRRRIATSSTAAARWLTPGLVDCHTHLVYAGNRAARIRAPAARRDLRRHRARRRRHRRDGARDARRERGRACRAEPPAPCGACGRRRDDGRDQVRLRSRDGGGDETAARRARARAELGVTVRTTLLAAHALPPEFAGRADDYIDYVCRDTIPAVARAGLADAVDAYCETIGFTPAQTQRVFAAARAHGLPVKLHADQLSDMDGARAGGRSVRAVRRSPRIHERRGRGGDGEGGDRGRAAARRVLRAARDAVAAGRRVPARAACRWRSPPTATPARRPRRRCC